VVVLELSSFQLQLVDRSPEVSAVLNIAPNHLDVHRDFDEYVQAKKAVYLYQRPADLAVFSADDPRTLAMAREKGEGVALFARRDPGSHPGGLGLSGRAYLDGDRLVVHPPGRPGGGGRPRVLCRAGDVRLRGEHNLLNILAAALMSLGAGGRLEALAQVASSFEGIEHRLEVVLEAGGVRVVNDSIATSPDRTRAALASFPGPLHLIAGGYDKKIPFDTLGEALVAGGKVRKLVLLGETAPKIRRAVEEAAAGSGGQVRGDGAAGCGAAAGGALPPEMEIVEVSSLEEAVREGFEGAGPGTTLLFSPACASFDMFQNYEERGRVFKEAARTLAAGLLPPSEPAATLRP